MQRVCIGDHVTNLFTCFRYGQDYYKRKAMLMAIQTVTLH